MGARPRVVVIGAGMGGLAAALELASAGAAVTVLERHGVPGGKMREVRVGGTGIDSGPTVFTMRRVFDELFAAAGQRLDDHVQLDAADLLARHAWLDGSRLDLYADVERSAAAIGELAGAAEAEAYRRFARHSRRVFETLDEPFMRAERPGVFGLTRKLGLRRLPDLLAINAFRSLWAELGRHFTDPRLRQLFGRYSTYCGSSPFRAPATLMLIAHAESAGVWVVRGGMQRLAEALAGTAEGAGAELRYGCHVSRLLTGGDGRAAGVELDGGECVAADVVVFNGDAAALAGGLLGDEARGAVPGRVAPPASLSALTLSARARASGFPLAYHTVFFGDDYPDEFDSIFARRAMTKTPTVYVCAQDRAPGARPGDGEERIFCLANAAPGDMDAATVARYRDRLLATLERHGLALEPAHDAMLTTAPPDFGALFPATGGALYGRPTHGWRSSFLRPGSRSRLRGLYLAGGSVHPGPGVPMAALSGRLAAASVRADLGLDGA